MPKDIKRFLFEYDHSEFLECDKSLANTIKSNFYKQNDKRNENISKDLKLLTKFLESLYIHYWLSGGTLLGSIKC